MRGEFFRNERFEQKELNIAFLCLAVFFSLLAYWVRLLLFYRLLENKLWANLHAVSVQYPTPLRKS